MCCQKNYIVQISEKLAFYWLIVCYNLGLQLYHKNASKNIRDIIGFHCSININNYAVLSCTSENVLKVVKMYHTKFGSDNVNITIETLRSRGSKILLSSLLPFKG